MTNQTSPAAHRLDAFYRALRRPGITRPARGRWFGGVASGLANRIGVDPIVVRIGFVVGSIFFGVGVAAYLALWLLLPAQDGTLRIERALRDGNVPSVALLVVTALAVVGPGAPLWGGFGHLHTGGIIVVAALVAWYMTKRRSAVCHHPSTPPQQSTDAPQQSTDPWRVEPTNPVPDDAPRN